MVKKYFVRAGAAMLAAAMLLGGQTVCAEERRLGNYIYIPAMTAPTAVGELSLRVEGLSLSAQSDEPQRVSSLAGAQFGVYVISGSGEVTPWANPLYPSEPMRIRTGEEAVHFALPRGTEFYLRQESAPEGYAFDSETLIPVTQEEIVVTNAMQGELLLSAADSLGEPVCGAVFLVEDDKGSEYTLVTGEDGTVALRADGEASFVLVQQELPEGVFEAIGASINGVPVQEMPIVTAAVYPAARTRVSFEHPASGSVELRMLQASVNEYGSVQLDALPDVKMEVEGAGTIVTDADGFASMSLLEGTYTVNFSYAGNRDIVLPFTQGQMIVRSGTATLIDLQAASNAGRVVVTLDTQAEPAGASVTLEQELSGERFGPYAFDAEGMAVSQELAVGSYRISSLQLPEHTQVGRIYVQGEEMPEGAMLYASVQPGQAAHIGVELLTRESRSYELFAERTDDQAQITEERLTQEITFELLRADDMQTAGLVYAKDGFVQVEGLSGSYVLRMAQEDAEAMGLRAQSAVFELPGEADVISFAESGARLVLSAMDENGLPLSGAVYAVSDGQGNTYEVICDANGEGISPLMNAENALIATMQAPQDHAPCAEQTVSIAQGGIVRVQVTHQSYGTLRVYTRLQRLDEQGSAVYQALDGVLVHAYLLGADGQTLTDTGIAAVSDESGYACLILAPGEYVVRMESMDGGIRALEDSYVSMDYSEDAETQLVCLDALGGVRVHIAGEQADAQLLAQMRFELEASDGSKKPLTLTGDAFYAGGLAAGQYILRQTQIPQGYTLAPEQTITVSGAMVAQADVALEEYALVSVSKTGLTFNDRLQTFVVPLTGQYGVYVQDEEGMKPYPSAQEQMTVWSNVTSEQIAAGKTAQLRLPASMEGSVYYLREISAAEGFAPDETYHEVMLRAGEQTTVSCTVSSDRGFFELVQMDNLGEVVSGGEFELLDASGSCVLSFEIGGESYRNAMALPVGSYTLRQKQAAEGYALLGDAQLEVVIEPYLTQGGRVSDYKMGAIRLPQDSGMEMIADLYAGSEQGLTLLTAEGGVLAAGESLAAPQMTMSVSAVAGERMDVDSVVLSGAADAAGSAYAARVEYCLAGGGWQPSDARTTGVLSGPTFVSLADIEDDISAVRVTYFDARTGEERAGEGFTPGQMTLNVALSASGEASVSAQAVFSGVMTYKTHVDGGLERMERSALQSINFAAKGSGVFNTVSAGRDGRISGTVFFDKDADGAMGADESDRYAGMTVSLLSESGDVVSTCRTDAAGRYAFDTLSSGVYSVAFDAGEKLVFSYGNLYSAQVNSAVADTQYGESEQIRIDGDHTDYVVNAGCIYAAALTGVVTELGAEQSVSGYASLGVELIAAGSEEPTVVLSGSDGMFTFSRILPGEYEVIVEIPEGFLCAEAENGFIRRRVTLEQGQTQLLGQISIMREAGVYGSVRVDDDGDGVIAQSAQTVSGTEAVLLRVEDGHSEEIARAITAQDGSYAFSGLEPGEYSVLFELDGEWTFTSYGEDSQVYGAVSQSGSTQSFNLEPGEWAQMNAGVTIPAQLSVMVFEDEHVDGQKGTYEKGLDGAGVTLVRMEGGEAAHGMTVYTDADGMAHFDGVSPGEYILSYQLPGQWRATKQVDPQTTNYPVSCVPQSALSSGSSDPFTLSMGQTGAKLYIGAMLSGSVGGTAFYDDNADGRFTEGEKACPGVSVELLDTQDNVIAHTQSGEDGSFVFEGLVPARYRVRFTAAQGCGYAATEYAMARGAAQVSDENVSTSRMITLYAGNDIRTANAAIVRLAGVSGFVWEDSSADALIGEDERGMSGVNVHLMNGAGRIILSSTVTDEDGYYAFDNLRPGEYKLRVDAPASYVFSGTLSGGALAFEGEREGRGYSVPFALLGGARAQDLSFGLLTQGTIGGMLFIDEDYDGLMGAAEEGLRGASVVLIDKNGEQAAASSTIRSGEFSFAGLMPGEYTLEVTLPEGYVFTADGGDSQIARSNEGTSSLYLGELAMGSAMSDIRIGALIPAAIGGGVFLDANNDGRRAPSDTGVAGVKVTLSVLSGSDQGISRETYTDAEGKYAFENVMPGEVELGFELEAGYAFARSVNGRGNVSIVPQTDDLYAASAAIAVASGRNQNDLYAGAVYVGEISGSLWEDRNYDGRAGAQESSVSGALIELVDARSGAVVRSAQSGEDGAYMLDFVREGEYVLRVTLPDKMIFTCAGDSTITMTDAHTGQSAAFAVKMGESRENVRFGAIVQAGVSGSVAIDWNENGAFEEDEPGLGGAVVTLMQGGTVIADAVTDENGAFAIGMLRPGEYRARIALPEGALFAKGTALTLAHEDAQEGETASFTLEMGDNADLGTVMAVEGAQVSGRVWSDQNADGYMDAAESTLSGARVELISGGRVAASVTTGENGAYVFPLLRSGVYSVRVTLPDQMLFTDVREGENASSVVVSPDSTGETQEFLLTYGETKDCVNAGAILPGHIGDSVWLDEDGNGLQDYREAMLEGVQLTLLAVHEDGSMSECARSTSDRYGYYAFDALRPGVYVIRVELTEGSALTERFGPPLGEIDSDADSETLMTDEIRLASGQVIRNIDFGLVDFAK